MNSPKRLNQDALYQALNIYRDAMRPFILKNLKTLPGLAPGDRFENEADIDIGNFPYLFREYWHDVFKRCFNPYRDIRSAVGLITEARNKVSHPGTEDLDFNYALSRLHEISDMLEQINAPKQKREVESIRDKLLAHKIALEEKVETSKPRPIDSKIEDVSNVIDSQPVTKQSVVPSEFSGEWTITQFKDSLSKEMKDSHEANFSEERRNIFYRSVAEIQNLIAAEGWRLKTRFNKKSCRFWLTDKGVTQVKSVFGIHLQYNPFTLHVRIMKKDAEELKRQCGCEFYSVSKNKYADYIYYRVPDDITEIKPVLAFAYKKHSGK